MNAYRGSLAGTDVASTVEADHMLGAAGSKQAWLKDGSTVCQMCYGYFGGARAHCTQARHASAHATHSILNT